MPANPGSASPGVSARNPPKLFAIGPGDQEFIIENHVQAPGVIEPVRIIMIIGFDPQGEFQVIGQVQLKLVLVKLWLLEFL